MYSAAIAEGMAVRTKRTLKTKILPCCEACVYIAELRAELEALRRQDIHKGLSKLELRVSCLEEKAGVDPHKAATERK